MKCQPKGEREREGDDEEMDSRLQSIRAGGRMNKGGRDRDKVSPPLPPAPQLGTPLVWRQILFEVDAHTSLKFHKMFPTVILYGLKFVGAPFS